MAPSHTKRAQTHRKGPQDSCKAPSTHTSPTAPRLSPLSLPFIFYLSWSPLFIHGLNVFWAPGCPRPTLEEGRRDDTGLFHVHRRPLLAKEAASGKRHNQAWE